jgi:hypothetical protein
MEYNHIQILGNMTTMSGTNPARVNEEERGILTNPRRWRHRGGSGMQKRQQR